MKAMKPLAIETLGLSGHRILSSGLGFGDNFSGAPFFDMLCNDALPSLRDLWLADIDNFTSGIRELVRVINLGKLSSLESLDLSETGFYDD
uniref:Uncharacterized protein n=1 Tax=Chromera velia CCMP2878 TaxID=1169474 RepID=A0A0G4F5X4_9ALVE|eukprot:Cvel_15180.t1-p1 / transcript=Cvel_15180.t1 / gene=Cvel_15180 / organism=Chromera_velia_CCMP2878 / gene_product=hypothetical protein / transcript_product=hypothetical protein / location=Cvel_scaffold1110:4430-4699(+) / protein_length=90 / sequence_SO=supercontig / SO=protein_coding / is_pseudo=false